MGARMRKFIISIMLILGAVLNANAYGARGTYRMKGTHYYELRDGSWIAVNK